jgi:hypothetical protein
MQPQDQIKDILIFLGRENDLEGTLRDKHITKILEYMIVQDTEDYAKTISKLAFKCGISARIIRENYLLGMEMFDIIGTYANGGVKHWKWQGVPIPKTHAKENPRIDAKKLKALDGG